MKYTVLELQNNSESKWYKIRDNKTNKVLFQSGDYKEVLQQLTKLETFTIIRSNNDKKI